MARCHFGGYISVVIIVIADTARKSSLGFPLTPRSMTLDDLELL